MHSPSLLLLSLAIAGLIVQQVETRSSHARHARVPWQHYASRHSETWQSADNWCRAAGLGGLLPASSRLSDVAHHLSRRFCYWVRPTGRWVSHREHEEGGGGRCLCMKMAADSLRLHRLHCRRLRRFICLRGTPIDESEVPLKATTKTPTGIANTATTKAETGKSEPLDDSDEPTGEGMDHEIPGDETVEHGKFPVVALRPDGHPEGWLQPWGPSTTPKAEDSTKPPSQMSPLSNNSEVHRNASEASDGTISTLQALIRDQNSEFVTLMVLYTIVGVTLMVLLTLCLVRCCRGYCGKSKIRYVKQVDADDIPRFMPSSWA